MTLTARIRHLVRECGLEMKTVNSDVVQIGRVGSPFFLGLRASSSESMMPYVYCRTTSFNWPGERTDLNDILSLALAANLRAGRTASSALITIPHPVAPIEGELYARFITLVQPYPTGYSAAEDLDDQLAELLAAYVFAEHYSFRFLRLCGFDGLEPEGTYEVSTQAASDWADQAERALRRERAASTFNLRTRPRWAYYRSHDGLSAIRSQDLSMAFTALSQMGPPPVTYLDANGLAVRSELIRNFIPRRTIDKARSALASLEGAPLKDDPALIPIENYVVATSGSHVLFLPAATGRHAYDKQIQAIERQREDQNALLNFGADIVWADSVPGHRFEQLVADLLRLEPGVSRVRSVGATSEPDGGRDLLVEWDTPLLVGETAEDEKPPVRRRQVIVQVKADKASVGRGRVKGIYDTIRHYEYDGYVLIVRSQLTVQLVDILEKIRMKGEHYADWWQSEDIAERLRRHDELVRKYSDIVTLTTARGT